MSIPQSHNVLAQLDFRKSLSRDVLHCIGSVLKSRQQNRSMGCGFSRTRWMNTPRDNIVKGEITNVICESTS